MNDDLKARLVGELGLTEEQAAKLAAEGVTADTDMALLSRDDIKSLTGCGLVTAAKVHNAFALPVAAPEVASTAPSDPTAEIPEGKNPSAAQVNSFATSMGIDPSMLTMMMFAGATSGAGMGEMDISGMIPIPQIVAGYNPKIRNMYLMIMGSLESRLGVPIVVINDDGSVDQALTVEYIMGLEEGRDSAENDVYFDGEGTPHEVIKVGVDAQSIYDADPCDPTKALQKNGMGVGRVNWNGVSLEVKQVAYYAVTHTREIDPTNDAHQAWLRDHIKPTSKRLVFQGQSPKAISAFNEAMRTGSLPTLRVMLTRSPRRKENMPRRRPGVARDLAGIGRGENEL